MEGSFTSEDFDDLDFLFLNGYRTSVQLRQLVVPYFQYFLPQKRSARNQIAGYPLELFESPPLQEFLCQICKLVVKKPLECNFCGQLYCEFCVRTQESCANRQFKCIVCEKECKGVLPSKVLVKIIGDLKVRCRYFDKGCLGFVKLGECQRHELTCVYRDVLCANNEFCSKTGVLKDFFESENRRNNFTVRAKSYTCSKNCSYMVLFKKLVVEKNLELALETYIKVLKRED